MLKIMVFCLFSLSLFAQDSFPYDPPPNFSLFVREGRVSHPVSTSNPEAQQYFDQGLTLIYAFNHDAAFWSFKKAAQLDPNLAMAYWGMALTLGSNINIGITDDREKIAYRLAQEAVKRAPSATPNEQAYIKALSVRYSKGPYPNSKRASYDKNYYNAMRKLVDAFPDDPDAATLAAEAGLDLSPWDQYNQSGESLEGTTSIVALLESVLKRYPDHLGANHYYIHAVEASKHPERALMSAYRLRHMLPSSGHIIHMPSHIYMLVGDYNLAAQSNEEAVVADKEYIRKYGMTGIYPLHYMSHNLYFLSRSYSMEGRYEDAKRAGNELYAFYAPHFKSMPDLEYYVPTALLVLVRFQKWQEVLDTPKYPSDMRIATAMWHNARALAFASLNDLKQAKQEQQDFYNARSRLTSEDTFGNNSVEPIMQIADLTLKAALAEAQDDEKSAVGFLKDAIAIQDQLRYSEPPDWSFSIRESLGGLLLRSGQFAEAEKVFREDLNRHPRNGRSLFGLFESLKAQSRHDDAYWVGRQLEKAWQFSTTPLNLSDL